MWRLVDAIDPDVVEERARQKYTLGATDEVNEAQYENARAELLVKPQHNAPLIDYLVDTQRQKEQKIDMIILMRSSILGAITSQRACRFKY